MPVLRIDCSRQVGALALGVILILCPAALGQAPGETPGGCLGTSFDEFDSPPVLLVSSVAVYPEVALMAGLEGDVVIRAWVESNGEVCHVAVQSSVHPLLSRAALDAVRGATFRPAERSSRLVPGVVDFTYRFSLHARLNREAVWAEAMPAQFVGDLIASEEQTGSGGGGKTTFAFNGVNIVGDLPLDAFLWIEAHADQVADGGDFVAIESTAGAMGVPVEAQKVTPVIRARFCMQQVDWGRCSEFKVVEVDRLEGQYSFGKSSVSHVLYVAD